MGASQEPRLTSQHDYRNEARKPSAVYLISSLKRAFTQLLMTGLMHKFRDSSETMSFHDDSSPK